MRSSHKSSNFSRRRRDERERGTRPTEEPARSCSDNCRRRSGARLSSTATSHMLKRLGHAGLVTPLRKGVWALAERPDRLALAEYVTAPYPAYLSLQSALYQHGMIEQIPSMIYLVSLARSARVDTALGTYSVHHVQPAFFDGFQVLPVDFLYLSPTRGRLFAALPELDLPRGFRRSAAREWLRHIPSKRLRTIVSRRLDAVLARVS